MWVYRYSESRISIAVVQYHVEPRTSLLKLPRNIPKVRISKPRQTTRRQMAIRIWETKPMHMRVSTCTLNGPLGWD
ncbi:hypothetical protein CDV31_011612 [Fusarium ambrosium]|uniref:Uncharacterized protein n=1 Tax=Fusarium ambrosium TaxID=131363 RepID=A0A428TFS6_9HYPO|nr:hypothetical protein CDV31_011612 [Fusarium ambrosium]